MKIQQFVDSVLTACRTPPVNRSARPTLRLSVLLALFLILAPALQLAWAADIEWALWALPADATMDRWLEIHNLDTARREGLYHVQVMGRIRGDPVWKYEHLADHLAVTEAALRASIGRKLKTGAMYPDSYNAAYQSWVDAKVRGTAFVCTTNVIDCLAKVATNNASERTRGQRLR